MRYLHAVWSLDDHVGGLMRAVVAIASLQAEAGHAVTVVTTVDESETHAALADLHPEVQVRFFGRSKLTARVAGSAQLRRWVRTHVTYFDSVHVHSMWDLPSYATSRIALRSGVPLIISPHGSLDPYDVRKHAQMKRRLGPVFLRRNLDAAATVLCTTQREARDLVTYGATPKIRVVPIPLSTVDTPCCDRATFRKKWAIPEDAPLLLFLSRLDAKKGLAHLLGALAQMKVPAHLLMVGAGDPEFENNLACQIADLGLEERITLTGWLSGADKAAAFAASDLFVLLSDFENYGIAVIEALQHGLPSVTSSEVYVGQDLADVGAILIAEREPELAARALDRALSDGDLRRQLQQHGLSVLESRLSRAFLGAEYCTLIPIRPEND